MLHLRARGKRHISEPLKHGDSVTPIISPTESSMPKNNNLLSLFQIFPAVLIFHVVVGYGELKLGAIVLKIVVEG